MRATPKVFTTTLFLALSLFGALAEEPGDRSREEGIRPGAEKAGSETRQVVVVEVRSLELATDKPSYRHGESMSITVKVSRDGFLRLFGVAADGQVTQIFPNDYQKDNSVKAGQTITIPDPEANRQRAADGKKPYQVWVEMPSGQDSSLESLHAVLSPEQFKDETMTTFKTTNPFPSLGKLDRSIRKTRGLTPTAVSNTIEGQATYELTRGGL